MPKRKSKVYKSKVYKCRHYGHGPEAYVDVEAHDPQDAAETFAEEYGVRDGEIVHVWQFGNYSIDVILEPEFRATIIQGRI